MRAVVQRVLEASVTVDRREVARIGPGLLVLVGVAASDGDADAAVVAGKLATLRIFPDDQGKLNRSVAEIGGEVLVVSQFTLLADVRKGRRPSFVGAARPESAEPLVSRLVDGLRKENLTVSCGRFGSVMRVALVNDGPVTIIVDSEQGKLT